MFRRRRRPVDLDQNKLMLVLACKRIGEWSPEKLKFVKRFRSYTDSQKPPVVRTEPRGGLGCLSLNSSPE